MDEKTLKSIIAKANRSIALSQGGEPASADATAAYILDLLLGLRSLTTDKDHQFLAYLISLAAEEAIRLAETPGKTTAQAGELSEESHQPSSQAAEKKEPRRKSA